MHVAPIDLWELATAVFVVLVITGPASALFAYAYDIVVTTAVLEMSMGWLAAMAGQAETKTSRAQRIALVAFGVLVTAAAAVGTVIELDAPGVVVPGLLVLAGRLRKPAGTVAFDARHCRTIELTAGTAWVAMIGAAALLMLLGSLFRSAADPEHAQTWVYAVVWGGFYTALAFAMPAARRRALRPRASRGRPA